MPTQPTYNSARPVSFFDSERHVLQGSLTLCYPSSQRLQDRPFPIRTSLIVNKYPSRGRDACHNAANARHLSGIPQPLRTGRHEASAPSKTSQHRLDNISVTSYSSAYGGDRVPLHSPRIPRSLGDCPPDRGDRIIADNHGGVHLLGTTRHAGPISSRSWSAQHPSCVQLMRQQQPLALARPLHASDRNPLRKPPKMHQDKIRATGGSQMSSVPTASSCPQLPTTSGIRTQWRSPQGPRQVPTRSSTQTLPGPLPRSSCPQATAACGIPPPPRCMQREPRDLTLRESTARQGGQCIPIPSAGSSYSQTTAPYGFCIPPQRLQKGQARDSTLRKSTARPARQSLPGPSPCRPSGYVTQTPDRSSLSRQRASSGPDIFLTQRNKVLHGQRSSAAVPAPRSHAHLHGVSLDQAMHGDEPRVDQEHAAAASAIEARRLAREPAALRVADHPASDASCSMPTLHRRSSISSKRNNMSRRSESKISVTSASLCARSRHAARSRSNSKVYPLSRNPSIGSVFSVVIRPFSPICDPSPVSEEPRRLGPHVQVQDLPPRIKRILDNQEHSCAPATRPTFTSYPTSSESVYHQDVRLSLDTLREGYGVSVDTGFFDENDMLV